MEKKVQELGTCESLGMTKIKVMSFIKRINVKFYQFSGFSVSEKYVPQIGIIQMF